MKDNTRYLRGEYAVLANKYAIAFCKKHGLRYSDGCWADRDAGGVFEIGDLGVKYKDMRYDVDEDVPVGEFEEYFAWRLENFRPSMTFKTWCEDVRGPEI